ncbi:MAG: hypothetical protein ACLFQB_09860 [Chitinispirillaceae bacterium]
MALRNKAVMCCLLVFAGISDAGMRDPFPLGYSMATQEGLMDAQGPGGRQPWMPAAYLQDTVKYGAAVLGTAYYGDFEKNASIFQYGAGAWFTTDFMTCKLALVQLSALEVYYEQTAYLSLGTSLSFLGLSVDLKPCRTGLVNSSEVKALLLAGISGLVQTRLLNMRFSVDDLVIESSDVEGTDPEYVLEIGLSSRKNRYGIQGVLIQVRPGMSEPVRFTLAQKYRIGNSFSIAAALGSNPTMISFGIGVNLKSVGGSAAMVNHPVLGWSKGFFVDFFR